MKIAVIVLNWNGEEDSIACIESLLKQTTGHTIVVVDNGSNDNFAEIVAKNYKNVVLIKNSHNLGFAGGVNTGIRWAINNSYSYVALINNDAAVDKGWLSHLVSTAEKENSAGIVTSKILTADGKHIDSTGDLYSIWGLPFPRDRNLASSEAHEQAETVFAGSGGASLYKVKMFKEIGLFDENFFAYYEDVDISFRAQLAGWKVWYEPKSIAYHKIGASSARVKDFGTYQAIKNLPWLLWKNVPTKLLPKIWPRFFLAHLSIIVSALAKGKLTAVFKGVVVVFLLMPKKLFERHKIQNKKKVSSEYILNIMVHDLPPSAHKLKRIRSFLKIKN